MTNHSNSNNSMDLGTEKRGAEIAINKGKYKGKFGWVDLSRGENGFSSTRKSVYVIYCEDGTTVAAPNQIRAKSIDYQNWHSKATVGSNFLVRNPKVGQKVSELCDLMRAVNYASNEDKAEMMGYVLQVIDAKMRAPKSA
ncbi:unnamed protein product [Cylindrotheca closterium]|uniref:Uncharacterized protein n=1 Tax=Cylindrotheca closterium TaxID=2856 RepID=A0AAD2FJX9_9STRA|nr:unnamed protein product [Cylindrotheca closterium]CAJ1947004.1 unnamed protein product [Cylindrotheca closterium]CAJ1951164.1 unnamed protein product [Cylindrotheca closterium]